MHRRKIIKALKAAGWYRVHIAGSHWQFKHPEIKGRVNISLPEDDLKHIDDMAQRYGLDRSGFMLFAAKNMMEAASRPA